MALIKCPDCGKEISDMAEMCLHCGRPMKENEVDYHALFESIPKDEEALDRKISIEGAKRQYERVGWTPFLY